MDSEMMYEVRRRDTLWQISRRYDTTPEAIDLRALSPPFFVKGPRRI